MDWALAIERNREALSRIVAALCAMVGLVDGNTVSTLPRHLRSRVFRILRPAESAVRRLIVLAARDVKITLRPAGERRVTPKTAAISEPDPRARSAKPGSGKNTGMNNREAGLVLYRPEDRDRTPAAPRLKPVVDTRCGISRKTADIAPAFPLADPRKRFDFRPRRRRAKSFPRITCIGLSEPTPIPDDWFPSPDDPLDATRLCRRLRALKRALDDLDAQARRLARLEARREAGLLRAGRYPPMRPGWPPGRRKRPLHEVDAVLRDCHSLARAALSGPCTPPP
jgi:hypothetical protein